MKQRTTEPTWDATQGLLVALRSPNPPNPEWLMRLAASEIERLLLHHPDPLWGEPRKGQRNET